MSKKLTCVVTGKSSTVTDEVFSRRVEEMGSEAEARKHHVCRQAQQLISRGYSVIETRELMKVTSSLPDVDDDVVARIRGTETFHSSNIVIESSHPRVVAFIERLKTHSKINA